MRPQDTRRRSTTAGPETEDASTRLGLLLRFLESHGGQRLTLRLSAAGPRKATVDAELPPDALVPLRQVLLEMSHGNSVAVLPAASALTTQQAARLLGVSRPHVVSLLEAGRIPFHMVGKHRRVRLPDLLAYREKVEKARKKTLDDLAAEDQALGIA